MKKRNHMIKQEKTVPFQKTLITEGAWGNVLWKFFADSNMPNIDLCTATFCIVTFQGKLVLVQHGLRGYEFPGGHIDPHELPNETIRREIMEESGVIVSKPIFFGYKLVSPMTPIPHRDNPSQTYPFPHSYVLYYHARADEMMPNASLTTDVSAVKLAGLHEALRLLALGHNHDAILRYLLKTSAIQLKKS